jgi:hypothetical protein
MMLDALDWTFESTGPIEPEESERKTMSGLGGMGGV